MVPGGSSAVLGGSLAGPWKVPGGSLPGLWSMSFGRATFQNHYKTNGFEHMAPQMGYIPNVFSIT